MVLLITIFTSILIFTLKPKNTNVNYDFYREIIIDKLNQKNVKIGNVIIENNGFLPIKVYFKKLKACIYNNNSNPFSFNIYYSLADKSYERLPGNYNKNDFIEVSTKDKKLISMRLLLESPRINEEQLEIKLFYRKNLKNKTLYIFEEKEKYNNYRYNEFAEFCENANKDNAIYNMQVMN